MAGSVNIDCAHLLASLNFLLVAFFFADFDFRGIFILDTTVWLRTFRNATVSLVMADMSAFVDFLIFGIIWRERLIKNNQAGGIMPNFDEDFPAKSLSFNRQVDVAL